MNMNKKSKKKIDHIWIVVGLYVGVTIGAACHVAFLEKHSDQLLSSALTALVIDGRTRRARSVEGEEEDVGGNAGGPGNGSNSNNNSSSGSNQSGGVLFGSSDPTIFRHGRARALNREEAQIFAGEGDVAAQPSPVQNPGADASIPAHTVPADAINPREMGLAAQAISIGNDRLVDWTNKTAEQIEPPEPPAQTEK